MKQQILHALERLVEEYPSNPKVRGEVLLALRDIQKDPLTRILETTVMVCFEATKNEDKKTLDKAGKLLGWLSQYAHQWSRSLDTEEEKELASVFEQKAIKVLRED